MNKVYRICLSLKGFKIKKNKSKIKYKLDKNHNLQKKLRKLIKANY